MMKMTDDLLKILQEVSEEGDKEYILKIQAKKLTLSNEKEWRGNVRQRLSVESLPKLIDITGNKDCKLETFYKEIGCNLITMVDIGEDYTLICDDEGLLVADNLVNTFTINGQEYDIAGDFLVMKVEGEDVRGLTDSEVLSILPDILESGELKGIVKY